LTENRKEFRDTKSKFSHNDKFYNNELYFFLMCSAHYFSLFLCSFLVKFRSKKSIYVCLQHPNLRICFITLSSVCHQLLPTCSSHEVRIKDFLMCSSVSLTQVSLIQSLSWISLFCTSTDIVHDEILNLKMCVCNIIWIDAENY